MHTKTLTSTETIVTKVPETIAQTVYTTSLTTEFETTDVYLTKSYPVTTYTTVVEVGCLAKPHLRPSLLTSTCRARQRSWRRQTRFQSLSPRSTRPL